MKEQNLIERIREMASREINQVYRTTVLVYGAEKDDKGKLDRHDNKLLNLAFRTETATDDEIFNLTKDLLELWLRGDKKEATCVFGPVYKLTRDVPLIATLTGKRNQMRFWIDHAGTVGQTHCDSCGSVYLMEMHNRDGIEQKYIDLASRVIASPFNLRNGGMVFARGNEPNLPTYYNFGNLMFREKIDYSRKK